MPSLHADACLKQATGGGDGHSNDGVFIRLGFDNLEVLEKFHPYVKNQATKTHVGYVYRQTKVRLTAHGISCHEASVV